MILFFALVGKEIMASGIDVMDPSAVSEIEKDPGLALELFMGTFTTGKYHNTDYCVSSLWFILAAVYKRLNALQLRFFPGRLKKFLHFIL